MNITKLLSERIERRVGVLDHKLIAPKVVPVLVVAEEEAVTTAVEAAEEASRLLVAQALEKALTRATKRITAQRIFKAYAASFRAVSAKVTPVKTDAPAGNSEAGVRGAAPQYVPVTCAVAR